MSSPSTTDVLKKAYLEIRALRSQLEERDGARDEPIAIVGLGCRFPGGVVDAESFWSVLRNGIDAVGLVPADRWDADALFDADPDAPGKLYARHGAFLDDIDRFDAAFFGIAPIEANSMDPQQRILLEVAWEALEDAAIPAGTLRSSRTGVFVGLMYQDYLTRQTRDAGRDAIGPYLGTGSTFSAAAGRLSYVLGLQGPSMAIDTACSSSLVAVHLACQALRNGECELALAGGANAILTPEASINLSKARMLSPSGRCRTFDAAADGYVRGEGAGLIVLKRLSQARRDGDRILGIVRGSAVNQDGRSNGLTAPNGSAQRALLQQALDAARVTADEVEYVECHGTGTPLGDPIEVGALLDVYGKRSAGKPLALGSVKTNFGHLESAAGICGLIKALLVLRNREVPPHLHLTKLNPHIDIEGKAVAIPVVPTPWFRDARRLAAVSAFGFVGTNAHIILESYDAEPDRETDPRDAHLLTLSAATDGALEELRQRYLTHLGATADDLGDICFTASAGRSHLSHRIAVVAGDAGTMAERLREASAQRAGNDAPRVAFLFTGQGSFDGTAGRRLYEAEPRFREVLDQCDVILRPHLKMPLPSVLFGDASGLLDQTRYAQPALVALEYAQFELWRSWGVEPSVMLGHSVGDYAVAIAAGAFTPETALTIVAERGRLMQALPSNGAMAAVFATESWGEEAIAAYPDTLAIAAINAPSEIVISGRADHLGEVVERARAAGIHARELHVSHAFHSPLMRPMLDPFRQVLSGIPDAQRWLDHVTAPVRFADAIETLRGRGDELLLELGPRQVLGALACRTIDGAVALTTLQPGRDDVEHILETVAALYAKGARIDWRSFHGAAARRKVVLPHYPFQRERYWIKAAATTAIAANAPRTLLGTSLPQAPHQPETFVWEADLDRKRRPYLFAHKLLGSPMWPIAAQIELAIDATRAVFGTDRCRITSLDFRRTLHALDGEDQRVQVVLTKRGEADADLAIYSRPADASAWELNTTARIAVGADRSRPKPMQLSMMFFAAKEEDDASDRYRLIIEAARFADTHGFRGVWVPERHFTHMGSLYPNPSVLHAALARETSRVRLMAGSVVLPLHNVARIAEEWAMVDNLSAGRVGISLAPGWNPDDFVLAPGKYDERYNDLYAGIETLRRLWRGETFEASAPNGRKVQLRTYPTPVQPELPLWITAARSAESFRRAGALGANVLTHLLDQDVDALAGKIALYREARKENGFDPHSGTVTVMCHTFVAPDAGTAQRLAKKPFCDYLKASMPLLAGLAYSRGSDVDVNKLSASELDEFVEFLYERFSTTRALIGTPETCRPLLDALGNAGVNEIACLLDFGPATADVLAHLPYLASMGGDLAGSHDAGEGSEARREQLRARCPRPVPLESFYATLTAAGVEFGADLRAVTSLAAGDAEALAEIDGGTAGVPLIDACIQTALATLPRGGGEPLRVPTGIDRVTVHRLPSGNAWAHARASRPAAGGMIDGSVAAFDDDGAPLLEIEGIHVKPIARPPAPENESLYELSWRDVPWNEAPRGSSRPWLIVEDGGGVARAWAARRRGAAHLFVQQGAATEQVGPNQWTIEPAGGFESLLRSVDAAAFEGILCALPLDASPNDALDVARLEAEQRLGVEPLIALVRALAANETHNVPPVWIVTRGAQPAGAAPSPIHVSQAALWGVAASLAREYRASWGGIVDLDPSDSTAQQAESLDRAISCGGEEDQVAIRDGRRHVRRLVRSSTRPGEVSLRSDAAYLITGGAGGLGLEVARWMAARGARHLILAGRSPSAAVGSIAANVTYVSVDLADENRLREILAQRSGPPIRGVIHAAGVFQDKALRHLDRDTLWNVLRAKVLGTWALHRAFAGSNLDFFVLFSSFSALTPPAGQAAYAAASAFADAVAHARRAAGETALSINWGAWSDIGFAATAAGREAHARLESLGMRRLTPAEGIAALEHLMADPRTPPQLAVFPNLLTMAAADPVLENRSLLRELLGERAVIVPHHDAALLHIRRMDAGTQEDFLRERVTGIVSEVLQIPRGRLDVTQPLTQIGLDSLIAVQIKNRLERELGLTVPLTSALRGASVKGMVEEMIIQLRLSVVSRSAESVSGAQQELEL